MKLTIFRTFVAISKMSRFTRFIWKVFAWKILLSGKVLLFLTLLSTLEIFYTSTTLLITLATKISFPVECSQKHLFQCKDTSTAESKFEHQSTKKEHSISRNTYFSPNFQSMGVLCSHVSHEMIVFSFSFQTGACFANSGADLWNMKQLLIDHIFWGY